MHMHGRNQQSQGVRTSLECPICGSKKKCGISSNGQWALCWKVESAKRTEAGSYLHRIGAESPPFPPKKHRASPKSSPVFKASFGEFERQAREDQYKGGVQEWAEKRGVTPESLLSLACKPTIDGLQIPERSPETSFGFVTCIVTRFTTPIVHDNGSIQKFRSKGNRGFLFSKEWYATKLGAVIIPEGFGCTAAAASAGFASIGRPSRNSDLRPLASMLKNLPSGTRIFVVLENDSDDPATQESHREQLALRASELEKEVGRKVFVVSPPSEHKDFNDWWCALSENKGASMPKGDRLEIGTKMLKEISRQAYREIIAANVAKAEKLSEMILNHAEMHRATRTQNGIDLDYDLDGSCAFRETFAKPSESKPGELTILGGLLACKRWNCKACRQRLLIPGWAIALTEGLAECDRIYAKWIKEDQVEGLKRKLQRAKATWVTISTEIEDGDESVFVLTSEPPKGKCKLFDLIEDETAIEHLSSQIQSSVGMVDYEHSRPISTSRGIRATEPPIVDDWLRKVSTIIEGSPLFGAIVSSEQAEAIRAKVYAEKKTGVKIDFLMMVPKNPEEPRFLLASSQVDPLFEISGEDAGLMVWSSQIAGHGFSASAGWSARRGQGYRRTHLHKGPEEVRTVARKLTLTAIKSDSGPIAAMVSASRVNAEGGYDKTEKNYVSNFLDELKSL